MEKAEKKKRGTLLEGHSDPKSLKGPWVEIVVIDDPPRHSLRGLSQNEPLHVPVDCSITSTTLQSS